MGQKAIADILDRDYGIELERKAVSRNISLLKEAGFSLAACGAAEEEAPAEEAPAEEAPAAE